MGSVAQGTLTLGRLLAHLLSQSAQVPSQPAYLSSHLRISRASFSTCQASCTGAYLLTCLHVHKSHAYLSSHLHISPVSRPLATSDLHKVGLKWQAAQHSGGVWFTRVRYLPNHQRRPPGPCSGVVAQQSSCGLLRRGLRVEAARARAQGLVAYVAPCFITFTIFEKSWLFPFF